MYIARQAIFDKSMKVFGYELLFRGSIQSVQFDGISSAQATASILGGLFESGISEIVEDKRAFVNFDAELIQSDALELFEKNRLVIEVLEDVEIDNALIERLKVLKSKGYKIALDDFVESYSTYPLISLADIIKYDLMLTPLDSIRGEVKKALTQNKVLLAEKIETREEYLKAKDMGFHLFQGYFFSKPYIVGESQNHTTMKSQYARMIAELRKEEPSYQVLAEIIEKDVNLAYRFVRLISKRSGKDLIYSIKWALTYMGLKEIERWIHILMLRQLDDSKPDELMRISLIRTKFSELIAIHSEFKNIKFEVSMMGLFSTIDAMLNQPMSAALQDIALPKTITEVLIEKTGVLLPVYQLLISYEKGDWITVERVSKQLSMEDTVLYEDYINAVKWAKGIMDLMY